MSSKLTVTVTLDGRLLIQQGRAVLELPDAAWTAELLAMLTEAVQAQQAIYAIYDVLSPQRAAQGPAVALAGAL